VGSDLMADDLHFLVCEPVQKLRHLWFVVLHDVILWQVFPEAHQMSGGL
jgi:hypothetical protein